MSTRAGKRPMRSLTAHEKLEAIRRVHDGESKASVARDIGVPESTLRGWCKNEDKISYLSRQSSPETDESLESQTKKPRLDDSSMQPFNLSLKSNGSTFSPNSESQFIKNEGDSSKVPLNLNTKTETPKATTDHVIERERNRAELARMSVELGLNRPEMFLSNLHTNQNFADLRANLNFITQWNNLLLQHQHQTQQPKPSSKSKISPVSTDINSQGISSSGGLLTTVDQEKMKHLPREQQSAHEAILRWLGNQQSKLNLSHNSVPRMPHPSAPSTSAATLSSTPSSVNTSAALNGFNAYDKSSYFWKWYNEVICSQQVQGNYSTPDKPILYQQLTKDASDKDNSPPDNAENLSVNRSKLASNKTTSTNTNKARSVLDSLLFNNNNNVAQNKRETKADEERLSPEEALEHGEIFLKWLEACSHPSVTAMHIMQFETLLNNLRRGTERKNGELQNKTKVKRK